MSEDEKDEFDSNEPPTFVAAGAISKPVPQRKIGFSAQAGSTQPIGLNVGLDSGFKSGDVSSLSQGIGAMGLRPVEELPPAGQNVRNEQQDDVFDYDPGFQEDPNEPFTESDLEDDDVDDDGSSVNEHSLAEDDGEGHGSSSSSCQAAAALFSTSVPINVPRLNSYHMQRHLRDHDHPDAFGRRAEGASDAIPLPGGERAGPHMRPDDMAASIQALARSVHGDKSELVFGELPKSRTYTRTLSTQPSTTTTIDSNNHDTSSVHDTSQHD